MAISKWIASSVLFACGIVLVFAGLSAALGFTPVGILASVAAIAALLYAGAVWFGATFAAPACSERASAAARVEGAPAGSETILVFDRSLRVAAGLVPGASLLSQFPEPLRPAIEMRCRAALCGETSHFACEHGGARIAFDIAPVQTRGDLVLYGVLISGSGHPVTSVSQAQVITVG